MAEKAEKTYSIMEVNRQLKVTVPIVLAQAVGLKAGDKVKYDSIYGALIIGFLAQLFISLIRYEIKELKTTSTKFVKNSLMNLTVTENITINEV